MSQQRHGAPTNDEGRPCFAAGEIGGASLRVDELPGAVERVAEYEGELTDDPGEERSQPTGRRRMREVHDEPRNRHARPAGSRNADCDSKRDRAQRGRLAHPEVPLECPVPREAAIERGAGRGRDQPRYAAPAAKSGQTGRPALVERTSLTRTRMQSADAHASRRTRRRDSGLRRAPTVADGEQAARALLDPGTSGRTGAPAEDREQHVRIGGRRESHGRACASRRGHVRDRSQRRRIVRLRKGELLRCRADAGVVPLEQKRGEATRGEEWPEATSGPPQPGREAGADRGPARSEQSSCPGR